MLRFLLGSGATSGAPYRDGMEGKCGIVLAGTLGSELNAAEFAIREGDGFAFPVRAMEQFRAICDAPCEAIWGMAPATV